jgi:hypothetical protein
MTVSAYPLGDSLASQDLMFNLLDHLYSTEGVFHDGDLAVSADTNGIGVKIASGGAVVKYDSVFGGKRVFFNSAENRSINSEFLNPSFDVDTTGWTGLGGATLTRDTVTFHSSPASCKVQTSGATTFGQGIQLSGNPQMKVDPNRLQEVSCWAYVPVGVTVRLSVTEHNSSLTQLTEFQDNKPGTGAWQKLKVNFTTHANAAYVWCQVLISSGSAQTYYVDSFEATRSFDWMEGLKPAHATLPRVDRVVIQILDSAISGGGDSSLGAKFRVIPGTPTSGATLTNLTGAAAVPSNAYLLANVLVPAAATALIAANIDTSVRVKPDLTVPSSVLSDIAALEADVAALDTRLDAQETAFSSVIYTTTIPPTNSISTVANYCTMTRITIERRTTIQSVGFVVGASAGNIDIGIYKYDAVNTEYDRLWSRGSVSCPIVGSAGFQISTGTPTSLVLDPGVYWLALVGNNGAFEFGGIGQSITGFSLDSDITVFALPATIDETDLSNANRSIHGIITGAA